MGGCFLGEFFEKLKEFFFGYQTISVCVNTLYILIKQILLSWLNEPILNRETQEGSKLTAVQFPTVIIIKFSKCTGDQVF